MVVRSSTRSSSTQKIFDALNGSESSYSFIRDYLNALRLYPVSINEPIDYMLPSIFCSLVTSVKTGLFMWALMIARSSDNAGSIAFEIGMWAFMILMGFCFVAGFVYKKALGRMMGDASYAGYVYMVGLSVVHIPYILLVYTLVNPKSILRFICLIILASISQFSLKTSMLKDHQFESGRDSFIFEILMYALQIGLVFTAVSTLSSFIGE
ncbi:hypothetical protein CWI42_081220 [Ordospora colligata]|uniref:Yip1 domain-containing protein n=1 Tax=Ordospora colligata OC4 TaxID=1354746 RepID=A0A0B2UE79_9MICR|nr:uncharacterized protein M896_081220 [Ordospora colligata OC4]KHN69386.1 hypothetical protein M896_081220 [Ordospora colligata OC4]TBU14900.1 hypothetical protein CWI41_081210 [Ordospora colligata]TBU15031.1 hypothetical protein CWI40_081230 [Ordospora colligata]TBU18285.1 hypothetical protein CWI42_081220 [Ordospora colligata]